MLGGELVGIVFGLVVLNAADDAERIELLIGVGLQLGLAVLGVDLGGGGLLVHDAGIQRGLEALVVGFSAGEGEACADELLLEGRVGEVHQDGVGLDDGAGENANADHGSVGLGGDELNALFAGDQGAEAADVAGEVAALDGLGPDRAGVHTGDSGLETHNSPGGRGDAYCNNGQHDDLPAELLFLDVGPRDVHCLRVIACAAPFEAR